MLFFRQTTLFLSFSFFSAKKETSQLVLFAKKQIKKQ